MCTRIHLSMNNESKSMLEFPLLNQSLESMVINNHSKALALENIEPYKTWLIRWKSLISNRSPEALKHFVEIIDSNNDTSTGTIKSVLNLLTLISDKPELIDKQLLTDIIRELRVDESDYHSEENFNQIFKEIDTLGFNSMGLFEIYLWSYKDILSIFNANYMIEHQYYSTLYQIIINNEMLESKKLTNEYPRAIEGSNRYHMLEYLAALFNNLIPAFADSKVVKSGSDNKDSKSEDNEDKDSKSEDENEVDPYDSDEEKLRSLAPEVKKLVKPAQSYLIKLIEYMLNKYQSVKDSPDVKYVPPIIEIEMTNQYMDNVPIGTSMFDISTSYLNIFERYRGNILSNDHKIRYQEAANYFKSHGYDIKVIERYAYDDFLYEPQYSQYLERQHTRGDYFFQSMIIGAYLGFVNLDLINATTIPGRILSQIPEIREKIDYNFINNYQTLSNETKDQYTYNLLERSFYLFMLFGSNSTSLFNPFPHPFDTSVDPIDNSFTKAFLRSFLANHFDHESIRLINRVIDIMRLLMLRVNSMNIIHLRMKDSTLNPCLI